MFAPGFERHVKVVLGADTAAYSRGILGATALTNKFRLGVVAASAAVVALGVGMAVNFIKAAAKYQDAMAKVKAISGATVAQFTALEDEAKRLGKITKFTLVEIAGGMTSLARAGLKPIEIIGAMGGVAALAASQSIELAEAGSIVTKALRGMGLDVTETGRAVNLFAATAASANLDVSMLSESFKTFAPLAAILKIPIETVAGMVAKLGDAGLQGTKATTALSTAFGRLADPAGEAARTLKDLNVEMWDAQGQFVGIETLIGRLSERYEGLTDQQRLAATAGIFGARAIQQMTILVMEGEESLRGYVDSITATTEALRQQEIMADTVAGQWVILEGSIDLLKTTLSIEALPVIQDFLKDVLIPWVNYMTDASEGTSVLKTAVEKLIVPFKWMIANGQKVKNALIAIGIGLAALITYTNPLLALVAALGYLVAKLTEVGETEFEKGLPAFGGRMQDFIDQLEVGEMAIEEFVEQYRFSLISAIGLMDEFGKKGQTALFSIANELDDLKERVLKLSPEEAAKEWILGVDAILSTWEDTYKELGKLRIGWLGDEERRTAEWEKNWIETMAKIRKEYEQLLIDIGWKAPTPTTTTTPVVSVVDWTKIDEFLAEFGDAMQTGISRLFGQAGTLGYDLVSGLVASMAGGGWGALASAAVNTFIAVLDALTAEMNRVKEAAQEMANWLGQQLMKGFDWLATKAQELAGSFADLVTSTQVYGELQSAMHQVQSAIMDALLGFLWPLVAIAQELLSIVGVTTQTAATVAAIAAEVRAVEIGVPRSWKRRRRAYEAAAPGEPYYPPGEPSVPEAGPELPTWVISIMNQFRGAIESALEPFRKFVGLLGEAWKALAPIILKGVLPAFESFGKNLIALAQSIVDSIPVFKKHLPSVIRGFLDFFFSSITGVATFWVDTFTDLLPNLDSFSVQVGELAGKLSGLFGALSDAVSPVLATFVDALAGVAMWINTTFLPDLKGFLSGFGDWWRTEVDPFLKANIFPTLRKWFTSLYEWIRDKFLPFLQTDVWQFMKNTLWPVIEQWGTIFSNFLQRVGDWVITNWPTIERLLTFVLNSLTQKLTAFLGRIEWWMDAFLGIGPNIPGFQAGGIVPGPIGRPQLVVAHGGEEILSYAQRQQVTTLLNQVHVYLGQDEVSDLVIERVRSKSKRLTGSRSTAAALTRRY